MEGEHRMKVYLYHISQSVNNNYDTYDSAIVAATTKTEARKIRPSGALLVDTRSWADIESVKAKLIGTAAKGVKANQVLCASFNAG